MEGETVSAVPRPVPFPKGERRRRRKWRKEGRQRKKVPTTDRGVLGGGGGGGQMAQFRKLFGEGSRRTRPPRRLLEMRGFSLVCAHNKRMQLGKVGWGAFSASSTSSIRA